jgi:glycosyltransferase involved in cell wall biosynthesis
VAISNVLCRHLVDTGFCAGAQVLVEHDGVDPQAVDSVADGHAMRRRLGIAEDATIIGYTGRVNAEKGINTILGAAALLQQRPVHFLVVGKQYDAEAAARGRVLGNVTMTGFVPPSMVPGYLAACDILAMPTSATLPYSRFTSPLKLFEYMASGRPIICSDLPVLREVLRHGENALLVAPDDPEALVAAVQRLLAECGLRHELAAQALRDVKRYAWNERAARIVDWMDLQHVDRS